MAPAVAAQDDVGVDRAVLGNERVLDDQILRAGAAQSDDVPAVRIDVVVGAGQQDVQDLVGAVSVLVADAAPIMIQPQWSVPDENAQRR